MNFTTERVLQDFLHREADHLPHNAGSPYERLFAPVPHRQRRGRRLVGPLTAAAAAVAVVAVAVGATMLRGPSHDDAVIGATDPTSLIPAVISIPDSAPSVLERPMARAALLVQTGSTDMPDAAISDPILVSPDGRAYRTLPTAASGAALGSVLLSAFALSPDGTRVAYAQWTKASPSASSLHIVDLPTGQITTFAMPGVGKGEQIGNLSWSPDGTRIAFSGESITVLPTPEGHATPDDAILDLATGQRVALPAAPLGWSADGRQLLLGPPFATGATYPDANALEIVDSTGRLVRTIPTGSLTDVQLGPGMWSPNGHAVATVVREGSASDPWQDPHEYTLRIASDQTGQPSAAGQIALGSLVGPCEVVGWHDASHVVVSERVPRQALRLVSVDVNTGNSTVVTEATNALITSIQVAPRLLPG